MLEAIPAWVVGRIAQTEVRPEIDDRRAVRDDVGDQRRGRAVGEGQEDGISLGQGRSHEQVGRREMRMEAADGLVLAVAAGEADDLDVRMAGEQADQLRPDVPRRADDPDPDPARSAVVGNAAQRAWQEPRRAVRRDRRGRLEPRAHGRVAPLTGGWLGLLAGVGGTVVMAV